MSVPSDSNGRPSTPHEAAGVLANLPRTRPQRSTPRRTAARKATAADARASATPARSNGRAPAARAQAETSAPAATAPRKPKAVRKSSSKPRARSAQRRPPATAPVAEPAPVQGFESETDRAHGPVHPPGGAELVASAAEIIGELAKAGLSTGERLLKDVLSHLPLS